MKPLLRFDDVMLRRGGRLLFESLGFSVGPSERLRIAGPNGAGKSSLLRLAAGLLKPEQGRVEAASLCLADEHLALDRELSLIDALRFWTGQNRTTLEAPLEALNLKGLLAVPVRLLSTGQRKRASLARAAASGAPLWLLDEPANGLDARSVGELAALVDDHVRSGGAVVAASHVALPGSWRTLELGA